MYLVFIGLIGTDMTHIYNKGLNLITNTKDFVGEYLEV